MNDIIQLLPESVANQIAAGEVIQRPASVIKELVENAIDAQSDTITIIVKDAGKTLIRVTDNGLGMSATDARMAFERHATSKITKADDLFALQTMGFRGEALASIAAIAQVELKTCRQEDELGTHLVIYGSDVQSLEPVQCAKGSTFDVKNLFFNVPARRKFLKKDSTEFRHILNEFYRISLANPHIKFRLYHNDQDIYYLNTTNIGQRIVALFGKNLSKQLVPVQSESIIVSIHGYVCKPEAAKKKPGDQYFFVNKRFMKHSYFHKAVCLAFENIIAKDYIPSYYLYLDIDPQQIDVNIHPTKTEINFENPKDIFKLLHSAIKESLGKHNIMPSIDFNTEGDVGIPVFKNETDVKIPSVKINTSYNPFDTSPEKKLEHDNLKHWQNLFEENKNDANFVNIPEFQSNQNNTVHVEAKQSSLSFQDTETKPQKKILQLKNRYIITPVKSGLMVIDQKYAHERILFENFERIVQQNKSVTQKNLFAETIEFAPDDSTLVTELLPDLAKIGFDIRDMGKNSFAIQGIPSELAGQDPKNLLIKFITEYRNTSFEMKEEARQKVCTSLAKAASIGYSKQLSDVECTELIDKLFACQIPNFSPEGKAIVKIITMEDLQKMF